MKKETIEQEIDRIRVAIYEETKDMTPEERVARTRRVTADTIKRYGFKVIKSASANTASALPRQ